MDAVGTCLVGGTRDHLARLGRVAATADDDRQAGEFGMALQLDRGEESVDVDVQDPRSAGGGHVPQSLRATVSHASPRSARLRPRSVSSCRT